MGGDFKSKDQCCACGGGFRTAKEKFYDWRTQTNNEFNINYCGYEYEKCECPTGFTAYYTDLTFNKANKITENHSKRIVEKDN